MKDSITGLRTLALFSARKLIIHRKWMMVLALTLLVSAVMGYSASQEGADIRMASDMMDTLMVMFLLPVLALIYGASMIRNEMDDRSIVQVITSPLDRRVSYLGYFLGLAVVLAILLSLMTIIAGSCFFVVNGEGEGAMQLILAFVAIMCIGAVVYSTLFLLMGLWLKQPLYLGLFYVFIWEGFIGSVPGAIGNYTIRHQLSVIASEMVDHGSLAYVDGNAGAASVVLLTLIVVLLAIGAFAFREKEVS